MILVAPDPIKISYSRITFRQIGSSKWENSERDQSKLEPPSRIKVLLDDYYSYLCLIVKAGNPYFSCQISLKTHTISVL